MLQRKPRYAENREITIAASSRSLARTIQKSKKPIMLDIGKHRRSSYPLPSFQIMEMFERKDHLSDQQNCSVGLPGPICLWKGLKGAIRGGSWKAKVIKSKRRSSLVNGLPSRLVMNITIMLMEASMKSIRCGEGSGMRVWVLLLSGNWNCWWSARAWVWDMLKID